NYVDAEQVKMAVGLVKEGETHPLGIVIDPNMPAFPPRGMMLQIVQPTQHFGRDNTGDFGWKMAYNDDVAQVWYGMGPQLDGLGHLGEGSGPDALFYNCNRGGDFAAITGLTKLGIHNVPPLVGRGVLIDMAEHKGVEFMEAGEGITSDDLKAAMEAQGIELREGDVVLVHTGWTDAKLESEPEVWAKGEPGMTNEAMEFLASQNVMAVGADTWGVEAVPPVEGDKVFYGHNILLAENGVYLLETMNTGRLAEEDVTEFMFVLGQPRVKGAVQAMINPVALW
ncbi:MAG TPA: cyclase family protein, partial [Paracoccaceae bacterium]|nr:cyclase family protein [Paracoccaceae bacterium]